MSETDPNTTDQNPFNLIAYLLFKTRQSLDETKDGGAPRWLRIARADASGGTDISTAVRAAMDGFTVVLSQMAEITLDVREVLREVDSAKAVLELTADFLSAATDQNFISGLYALIGKSAPATNPLGSVNTVINTAKDKLDIIPEPADLERLGYELYQMLNITQLDLPTKFDAGQKKVIIDATADADSDGTTDMKDVEHVNMDLTGRIRLIQFAMEQDITARGIPKYGGGEETQDLLVYGGRRLYEAGLTNLAERSVGSFTTNGATEEVFAFRYRSDNPSVPATGGASNKDLKSLHAILTKMGYNNVEAISSDEEFSEATSKMLKGFQKTNNLPITGFLNNVTLNLLINLDFEAKNLKRARPYDPAITLAPEDEIPMADALPLVNPDADHPEDEGITVQNPPTDQDPDAFYFWYKAGSGNEKKGWVIDPTGAQSFVAMQSRAREGDRFHGGKWSEGEGVARSYFWCARFTEPWIAGRTGNPTKPPALWNDRPSGQTSRMYQWVDISHLKDNAPSGRTLRLTLSAMQRSLWVDRGQSGRPDNGRLILQAYANIAFPDENMRIPVNGTMVKVKEIMSDYFPSDADPVPLDLPQADIDRKQQWYLKKTPELVIDFENTGDEDINAVLVMLEGKHHSAFDIDAYFDNVKLEYQFIAK